MLSSTGFPRPKSASITLLALSCILWLTTACSKKDSDLYHIPQESDFVVAVDMQSMALKALNFKDLLNINLFLKKDSTQEATLAERIQRSGIDFLGKAYMFGQVSGMSGPMGEANDSINVVFMVPMKDAGQFETFLKQEKGQMEKEEGGLKFCANDSLLVGWNDKTAFITWKKERATAGLKKRLIDLLNLPADRSLVEKNTYFSDLRKKSFDVLFWVNGSKAAQTSPTIPGLAALKDNYMGSVLNFEKGEVVFDGNFVSNNASVNKYADLMDTKVGQDLLKNIPTASPLSAMALKLNLKTVKKILQDNNMLSSANMTTQMLGMSAEEMLDMLTGEVVVSIVNLPDTGQSIPEMYVGLGIANEASLQKLVGNFKNQGFLADEGRFLSTPMSPGLSLIPQNKQLTLVTSAALRESVLSGKGAKLDETTSATLQKGAFSFYFDYNTLVTKNAAVSKEPEAQLLGQYLQSFEATSTQTSASTIDSKFVVTLKDKSQNSLTTLIKLSQEFQVIHEKRVAERKATEAAEQTEVTEADSTSVQ